MALVYESGSCYHASGLVVEQLAGRGTTNDANGPDQQAVY